MKDILKNLDKAFENRIRLAIMSALAVNEYVSYNDLKDLIGTSDGNLASHLKHLEKKEYIIVKKEFLNRKPHTSYKATVLGSNKFQLHIKAIEQLLSS